METDGEAVKHRSTGAIRTDGVRGKKEKKSAKSERCTKFSRCITVQS